MIKAKDIINEAMMFGSCYIGSFKPEFAEASTKTFKRVERYAKRHGITTQYVVEGYDAYIIAR